MRKKKKDKGTIVDELARYRREQAEAMEALTEENFKRAIEYIGKDALQLVPPVLPPKVRDFLDEEKRRVKTEEKKDD